MFPRVLGIVLSLVSAHAFAQTEDDWGDESADWGDETADDSASDADWGESEGDDWNENSGDSDWGESTDDGFGGIGALNLDELGLPGPEDYRFEATLSLETDSQFWLQRIKSEPLAKLAETMKVNVQASGDWWQVRGGISISYDAAYLMDRLERDLETLRTYEFYALARETSAAVELGAFSLKHGLIAPSFSELDLTSSLDLVSVFDLREPGLREPEDVRLPVWASRLGGQWSGHSVEAIVIHEPRYDLRSPPFGPFGPVKGQLETLGVFIDWERLTEDRLVSIGDKEEEDPFARQQAVLRYAYRGGGVDFTLLAASIFDRVGELENVDIGPWLEPKSNLFELTLLHRRYEIAALGLATSLGSWLLKSELVYRHRQPTFFRDPTPGLVVPIVAGRHELVSGAIGLTTSGDGWQIGVEATQAFRISSRDIEELQDSERGSWAFRAQFLFARDVLNLSFIGLSSGWMLEGGGVGRTELGWSLDDEWSLAGGIVGYLEGKELGPFAGWDRHTRGYLRLTWAKVVY